MMAFICCSATSGSVLNWSIGAGSPSSLPSPAAGRKTAGRAPNCAATGRLVTIFSVVSVRLPPASLAALSLVVAAAPAGADPARRLEVGGFLGLDYFGDDIELGNSWADEQVPGTSLLLGARGTFIGLPDLWAGSSLDPQLGLEAEVKLAFA